MKGVLVVVELLMVAFLAFKLALKHLGYRYSNVGLLTLPASPDGSPAPSLSLLVNSPKARIVPLGARSHCRIDRSNQSFAAPPFASSPA